MFGIGEAELAIIVTFAFLLFGPDKLPGMGRTIGRVLRQFREAQEGFTEVVQSQVLDPLNEAMSDADTKNITKRAAALKEDADRESGGKSEGEPIRGADKTHTEHKTHTKIEDKKGSETGGEKKPEDLWGIGRAKGSTSMTAEDMDAQISSTTQSASVSMTKRLRLIRAMSRQPLAAPASKRLMTSAPKRLRLLRVVIPTRRLTVILPERLRSPLASTGHPAAPLVRSSVTQRRPRRLTAASPERLRLSTAPMSFTTGERE